MKLSEQYAAAMRAGNHGVCYSIERRQGLDGWPPELVSVGLLALERGEDPYRAIAERFDAAVEEARGNSHPQPAAIDAQGDQTTDTKEQ